MSQTQASQGIDSSGQGSDDKYQGKRVLHDDDSRNLGQKVDDAGYKLADRSRVPVKGRDNVHKGKGKHSFASLFKDNRVADEASLLKYIAPPEGDIEIGIDEIDSVEKAFGFCLVGYVMGPRPSPYAVMNFMKGWGGQVKFFFKENGWIKFQFTSESERDLVLNGGPYMILGRQLFLKKLPSCFLYSKEDMVFLPCWIQIFGLPAECWTTQALSRIASVLGKPIHTDKLTITKKGSTYARVLVELDAKKPRVWERSVKLPTGMRVLINFKYEMEPKYCDKCQSLGHNSEMCGIEIRKETYPQKNDPRRNQHVDLTVNGQSKDVSKEGNSSGTKENMQELVGELHYEADPKRNVPIQQPVKSGQSEQHITVESQSIDNGDGIGVKSGDRDESNEVFGEEYDVDSEEVDDTLSCVDTQDKKEWKTVSKNHRRLKNKNGNKKEMNLDNSSSSRETEYIPIDPKSKLPLKGGQSIFLKRNSKEVRLVRVGARQANCWLGFIDSKV